MDETTKHEDSPAGETTHRVIESLVLRGDISALTPEERQKYYLELCEKLGLTPGTLPFAILRLNGKEIFYPTRSATDQLAAIHQLSREVIDGPKVIDLAGTKLIYAVCRATHPNGRTETAVATVKFADLENAFMKVETKAKRRATLSILGLGILDEADSEIAAEGVKKTADPAPVPSTLTTASPPTREVFQKPEVLTKFLASVEQIELPGEAVHLWLASRSTLSQLNGGDGLTAWNALCRRTEAVGKMKSGKTWLVGAIKEEEQRREAEQRHPAPALDALRRDLAPFLDVEHNVTLLEAARIWNQHSQSVYTEADGRIGDLYEAQREVLGIVACSCTRHQLTEHVLAVKARLAESCNIVFADAMDLLALSDSCDVVVTLLKEKRSAVAILSEEHRSLLRKVAVRRVQELHSDRSIDARRASAWLKNALDPSSPAPAVVSEDTERAAIQQSDGIGGC